MNQIQEEFKKCDLDNQHKIKELTQTIQDQMKNKSLDEIEINNLVIY